MLSTWLLIPLEKVPFYHIFSEMYKTTMKSMYRTENQIKKQSSFQMSSNLQEQKNTCLSSRDLTLLFIAFHSSVNSKGKQWSYKAL